MKLPSVIKYFQEYKPETKDQYENSATFPQPLADHTHLSSLNKISREKGGDANRLNITQSANIIYKHYILLFEVEKKLFLSNDGNYYVDKLISSAFSENHEIAKNNLKDGKQNEIETFEKFLEKAKKKAASILSKKIKADELRLACNKKNIKEIKEMLSSKILDNFKSYLIYTGLAEDLYVNNINITPKRIAKILEVTDQEQIEYLYSLSEKHTNIIRKIAIYFEKNRHKKDTQNSSFRTFFIAEKNRYKKATQNTNVRTSFSID